MNRFQFTPDPEANEKHKDLITDLNNKMTDAMLNLYRDGMTPPDIAQATPIRGLTTEEVVEILNEKIKETLEIGDTVSDARNPDGSCAMCADLGHEKYKHGCEHTIVSMEDEYACIELPCGHGCTAEYRYLTKMTYEHGDRLRNKMTGTEMQVYYDHAWKEEHCGRLRDFRMVSENGFKSVYGMPTYWTEKINA